ncbi:hypothetical protein L195_g039738 [Trifolium pratense]|uniref:Uncharacterized protein n=1 Tax=Trifolium pratense TaxID=57577 RepID=A0A2K3LYS8_TRIPR|nr:hypothetical protein L195_g039738 [Trifolium pratense]
MCAVDWLDQQDSCNDSSYGRNREEATTMKDVSDSDLAAGDGRGGGGEKKMEEATMQ